MTCGLGGAVLMLLILGVAGCGAVKVKPAAPVKLSELTPSSGLRISSASVAVTGAVTPRSARVLVAGRRANVSQNGHFSISVPLQDGTNLIDVIAGAPHARAAMTALRVVRYVLVRVPSVGGLTPKAAVARIKAADLRAKLEGDNPFSFLVPGSEEICSQSPAAGSMVTPGKTVILSTGKLCL